MVPVEGGAAVMAGPSDVSMVPGGGSALECAAGAASSAVIGVGGGGVL